MSEIVWVSSRDLESMIEQVRGACLFLGRQLIGPLQDGDLVGRAKHFSIYRKGTDDPEKRANYIVPARVWRSIPSGHFEGTNHFEAHVDPAYLTTPAPLADILTRDLARVSARGLSFERQGLVEALDLTANEAEILGGSRDVGAPVLPPPRQVREKTAQQVRLGKFLALAPQHLPGGSHPLSNTELRREFMKWNEKQTPRIDALQRVRFNEWVGRWNRGEW